MLVQLTLVALLVATMAAPTVSQAKEGCVDRCGNVSIPYPFGTTESCSLSAYFLVSCDNSYHPPMLVAGQISPAGDNVPVLNISLDGELLISSYISHDCYNSSGVPDYLYSDVSNLWSGQFTISGTRNKFTMVGCDTNAWVEGQRGDKIYRTGCMSICDNINEVQNGSCSGTCCCQTSIPDGLWAMNLTLHSFNNYTNIWGFNPCGYAFVVEESYFNFSSNHLMELKNTRRMPLVFDWAIGEETCQVAETNQTSYACKGNSTCYDSKTGRGYLCNCSNGYQGNPYLEQGCQDINECENPFLNMCKEPKSCTNIPGNHTCSCPMWYYGDGRKDGDGCIFNHSKVIRLVMGIGIGVIVLLLVTSSLYWAFKKRKLIKLKERHFQENGGVALEQHLLRLEGSQEKFKIFTAAELEKATKNYDESKVIGQGGFGTVYKGGLTDGRIVAIKKSRKVEQSQAKEFINEVVILSQINHRYVVKLLGCCLETEVPLLVYEFVNNGTLSDHIHDERKACTIPWKTRLRIAIQTAEALYYLHSSASTPVIHRDVKSANILLDDHYNVKVSDFGASRLVQLDKTHLSTVLQGTPGYMDPESMQTNQLTEKSDVYSFGVVLVELLTGRKAVFFDRPKEQRILAMFFLFALKDSSLYDVVEDCIASDGDYVQILKVAQLAKRCLSMKGEDRPSMKEVVMKLEAIRMIGENGEQNPKVNASLPGKSPPPEYHQGSNIVGLLGHCFRASGDTTETNSMGGNVLLQISGVR